MKIVYTYSTSNGLKPNMNFSNKETFIEMGQESIRLAKEHFGDENVYIYTDKVSYEFIKDVFDVKYEIVDFGRYRISFWNYPKLVTYSLQTEPFIHIDFDFLISEKISDNVLNSDIITEKIRGRNIPKLHCSFIDSDIWLKTPNIICSGLIGGNNLQIWKELKEYADTIVNRYDIIIHFNSLVGIEEVYVTYLQQKYNLKIAALDTEYIHYQSVFYK